MLKQLVMVIHQLIKLVLFCDLPCQELLLKRHFDKLRDNCMHLPAFLLFSFLKLIQLGDLCCKFPVATLPELKLAH